MTVTGTGSPDSNGDSYETSARLRRLRSTIGAELMAILVSHEAN
jgi:hypothetical protein